uniref:Cilia- and flagella-associated protein 300 n=1 Tax=Neogobius melanostomus TaxID=47308 RepID=A0A8C6TH55_9GOBI
MAGEGCEFEKGYTFSSLQSKKFTFLQNKETLSLLMKWSMLGRLSALAFSFDQCFSPYNSKRMFLIFALCVFAVKPIESIKVEVVPCSKVSIDLFDPIYSSGIVMPSGHIVNCFHEIYPDYDKLRQMLNDEESEHFPVISQEERQEFLFRLFKHLCLGGELCQNELNIEPYISTTKKCTKNLSGGVQKDPETKKISVVSTVLKVAAFDESGPCFPGRPEEEEQTFAYLVVDPYKRHVTLLYHIYGIGDFSF